MSTTHDVADSLEHKIRQREAAATNGQHPLELRPIRNPHARPAGVIPNTPLSVATISFLLGITFALGFLTFVVGGFQRFWWSTYQFGFYMAAWAFFHWGEFAVTAAFLLENGSMYHIAHSSAIIEYLVTVAFAPSIKQYHYVTAIGILLVIVGQTLRSTAMIHAATSFSHSVQFRKLETHTLVTSGVYGYSRHPSYAGFFYWALGTQLVLQNPLNFVFFAITLWKFFSERIGPEETALVRFFGQDYVDYRKRVGTGIPFIR